ncbi:hypothetical protein ACH4KU_10195 [Streptomyces althioticus]|uniref:hypothetical protein n=1 Tax=Streptomyces TaxID=1883 RepID=UPI0033C44021
MTALSSAARPVVRTVIFAPISSVPTTAPSTHIDNDCPVGERWQAHIWPFVLDDNGRNGMANKIEIRPLDKKETTGDSGGNGGS